MLLTDHRYFPKGQHTTLLALIKLSFAFEHLSNSTPSSTQLAHINCLHHMPNTLWLTHYRHQCSIRLRRWSIGHRFATQIHSLHTDNLLVIQSQSFPRRLWQLAQLSNVRTCLWGSLLALSDPRKRNAQIFMPKHSDEIRDKTRQDRVRFS